MTKEQDQERTKRDRIERLRERVKGAMTFGNVRDMGAALLGILDLLADEL